MYVLQRFLCDFSDKFVIKHKCGKVLVKNVCLHALSGPDVNRASPYVFLYLGLGKNFDSAGSERKRGKVCCQTARQILRK